MIFILMLYHLITPLVKLKEKYTLALVGFWITQELIIQMRMLN